MASDAAPRYRQVADALQRGIATGDLASHDRVASERSIADRFGCHA
jgi:DNA-binding GntR family transcriptional regulator